MQKWAEDACEQIDAGLFTGDTFYDPAALARFEWYVERWQRAISQIRNEIDSSSQACGCRPGECESKPVGCRMVEEVKPGSGAQ